MAFPGSLLWSVLNYGGVRTGYALCPISFSVRRAVLHCLGDWLTFTLSLEESC